METAAAVTGLHCFVNNTSNDLLLLCSLECALLLSSLRQFADTSSLVMLCGLEPCL